MKKYEEAKVQMISLSTSDIISTSWEIQNLGALDGFGKNGVDAVGIDEIS